MIACQGIITAQDDHLPVRSSLCGLSGCGITLPALQALGHPLTIASCAVPLCVHNWSSTFRSHVSWMTISFCSSGRIQAAWLV